MNSYSLKELKVILKSLGVSGLGMRTPEVKELANILRPNEHLGGVLYGRHASGFAWLVATDSRIIFLNKKPFYTKTDEITYEVVSGINSTQAGLFTTVVLHTRIEDYVMRYVKTKCAEIFVKYIETRQLVTYGGETISHTDNNQIESETKVHNFTDEAINYLKNHDMAVISTVDRTGNVFGAVVYYTVDQNNNIYILTKSRSSKDRNIYAHSQVALTVYEAGTEETVQLQGMAETETNQKIRQSVFDLMIKPRQYNKVKELPPVTKLHDGSFTIIRITPTTINYTDYSKI